MKYSVIGYLISEGFKNVLKNKKSTLSCLGVMCATMLIFGIFFAISQNINHIMNSVEGAQGMQIFIRPDATEQQILKIEEQIKNIKVDGNDAINTIKRVSKQEAYDTMQERLKDQPGVMEGVEVESFKVSFIINLTDLKYSSDVERQAKSIVDVVKVRSSEQTINTLMSIANGIKIFTFVILVVLVVVSLFIISNTIKLSVHARRKEISIMKYVGATNSFIRAPFAVEGIVIGLIAGIISILIVCLGYNAIADKFLSSAIVEKISTLSLLGFGEMVNLIVIVYIVLGVGIGIIGSTISMRKYLDV